MSQSKYTIQIVSKPWASTALNVMPCKLCLRSKIRVATCTPSNAEPRFDFAWPLCFGQQAPSNSGVHLFLGKPLIPPLDRIAEHCV